MLRSDLERMAATICTSDSKFEGEKSAKKLFHAKMEADFLDLGDLDFGAIFGLKKNEEEDEQLSLKNRGENLIREEEDLKW